VSATAVGHFDRATAIAPDGTVEIDAAYRGFVGAHGGYVAAIALRALTELVADAQREPRSLTIQLLAPVRVGPLATTTQLSRAGRSMAAGSVRMEQDGETVAVALGAFGRPSASLDRRDVTMPDVPPPEECEVVVLAPPGVGSFKHVAEHRAAAPPLPLSGAADAELSVWLRMTEEHPLDALSACFLADAAPPALMATLTEFAPIPSAEISLHFAAGGGGLAAASSPWLLGVFRSRDAGEGYATEDGELWTPDGELVALSRQLRRLL
jgi:acyl-CoA thioesterase